MFGVATGVDVESGVCVGCIVGVGDNVTVGVGEGEGEIVGLGELVGVGDGDGVGWHPQEYAVCGKINTITVTTTARRKNLPSCLFVPISEKTSSR